MMAALFTTISVSLLITVTSQSFMEVGRHHGQPDPASLSRKPLMRRAKKKAPATQSQGAVKDEMTDQFVKGQSGDIDKSVQDSDATNQALNTCDDDFPLGPEKRNACTDPAWEHPILDRELCVEAAKEAGVLTVHAKFDVPDAAGWRWKHPRGCFKLPCNEAHAQHAKNATAAEKARWGSGYCYFYNPIGTSPPEHDDNGAELLNGVPVCTRPKIIPGTVDATTKASQCKAGYGVIMNENNCSEAAECLGKCAGKFFRIDEEVNSMFENYPEGCFIEKTSGCVYMNPRPNNWPHAPTNPVGTPLCNVSEITLVNSWPSPAPANAGGLPDETGGR